MAVENPALRHRLNVLQRTAKTPHLRGTDRLLWVVLSRFWKGWRDSLTIVRPETVIRWHREGFRLYWRWRSRRRGPGRPKVPAGIRDLIRRECLNHVVVFSERPLRRVLKDYMEYHHGSRTHLGLEKDCPEPRRMEPPAVGEIRAEPMVGGLHHRYFRRAA